MKVVIAVTTALVLFASAPAFAHGGGMGHMGGNMGTNMGANMGGTMGSVSQTVIGHHGDHYNKSMMTQTGNHGSKTRTVRLVKNPFLRRILLRKFNKDYAKLLKIETAFMRNPTALEQKQIGMLEHDVAKLGRELNVPFGF